jgi:hypothetical protein
MGSIVFTTLIAACRKDTFDTSADPRHSDADYLAWGNAGQRQMAIYKPDVSVSNRAERLSGGTLQAVPADAIGFARLVRNMGLDGHTPGKVIECEDLDAFSRKNPYWHMADPAAEVRYYFFKTDDPKHFYVYPPQPATGAGHVEGIFYTAPAAMANVNAVLSVDDIYSGPLQDYLMFRIYDADSAVSPYADAAAVKHWNAFVQALGRLDLTKQTDSPKTEVQKEASQQWGSLNSLILPKPGSSMWAESRPMPQQSTSRPATASRF